jgi:hypothetical protein
MRRLQVFCIGWLLAAALVASARADAAPHFPLRLTRDHHHLVDGANQPFLVKVFSAWGLIQSLSEADAVDFMDSVKARGFNTLLVSAISWDRRFAGDPPRWNGISPFTSEWDFSTPNPEYFAHVDRVLELARARGLLVLLVPCYLGYYSDPTQGWAARLLDTHNDPQKSLAYGRYLGLRYRGNTNIIWVAGGDNDGKDAVYPHMRNVIAGIKQSADQLWTGHFDTETRFATNNPLYADVMDIDSLYLWVEERGGGEPQHASELARLDAGPHALTARSKLRARCSARI